MFKAEQYIKEALSVIEAKRLMNTLQESALKDSLTGLYNTLRRGGVPRPDA
jgi:two-component system cell cycle response regulator